MAGRPPKPKHIKEAQGTLEKSREVDNPLTFAPLVAIPEAPTTLTKSGRDFFNLHCEILCNVGQLTAGDISSIIQASRWYAIFDEASKSVFEDGGEQDTSTGYKAATPAFTRMVQAQKYLNEFQNKYGFNLASRQRISMPTQKPENELFD